MLADLNQQEYTSSWSGSGAREARRLARFATQALIDEADLTPKPGLVDRRGPGAHTDLCLELLHRSAMALQPTFEEIAKAAYGQTPNRSLRERLGEIGRMGERNMTAITRGVNTHRGAIWSLGLLVAGAALSPGSASALEISTMASAVAQLEDRYSGDQEASHGARACRLYAVDGAKGEARRGFPHVIQVGLPVIQASRSMAVPETLGRLDALLAIIATLEDTCLLHRGGRSALRAAQRGARRIADLGGVSTSNGWLALLELDQLLRERWISPGGSADLLAATLFLDSCNRSPLETYGFGEA